MPILKKRKSEEMATDDVSAELKELEAKEQKSNDIRLQDPSYKDREKEIVEEVTELVEDLAVEDAPPHRRDHE